MISNKVESKNEMREGGRLYCCCHRQTCKVCIDQRLAATEATCTGPCSALLCSSKLQNTSKRRERNYTASCGASRKPNTRERKIEKKDFRIGKSRRLRWFAKT